MAVEIKNIIAGELETLPEAFKSFIERINPLFTFPFLDENSYRSDLWKALYKYLSSDDYSCVRISALITIRILSREKKYLHELVNTDLLDCICLLAGLGKEETDDNYTEIIEALKCLVNLVYNCTFAAITCSRNGVVHAIIKRTANKNTYENAPLEMQLLDFKVLFVLSALQPDIRKALKNDFFDILVDNLHTRITYFIGNPKPLSDPEVDTICEILKILFNITIPLQLNKFEEMDLSSKLVEIARDILLLPTITESKKVDLQNHAINLLTNVQVTSYKNLFVPLHSKMPVVKQMQYEGTNLNAVAEILDFFKAKLALNPAVSSQYEVLAPVLIVLMKCARGDRILRKYLRQQILPPLKDVRKRPEEGDSIRSALCRLLTSPITEVKSFVADLLFILCKENIGRMIKYTGYGNAAGLFASRGLLGKETNTNVDGYSSESGDSDTEEYKELKHGINPVVGCYEAPKPKPTADMTEEQKEYEAMQLVQLIDQLSKQGVVQPCRVGADGTPKPVTHIMELTENVINSNRTDEVDDE